MTRDTKQKVWLAVIVCIITLVVQTVFAQVLTRWQKGEPFLREEVFNEQKKEIIKTAYDYTDDKVQILDKKIEDTKKTQDDKFNDIKSDLTIIKNYLINNKGKGN